MSLPMSVVVFFSDDIDTDVLTMSKSASPHHISSNFHVILFVLVIANENLHLSSEFHCFSDIHFTTITIFPLC